MDLIKDILIQGGLTAALALAVSLLTAWIKKGQFETWGKTVGRFLSTMGNARLGREKWEKIEDVVTLSILSFAKGVKVGADEDDNGELNRIEDKLINGGKVD